jgi:hypothetical protein
MAREMIGGLLRGCFEGSFRPLVPSASGSSQIGFQPSLPFGLRGDQVGCDLLL